MSRQHTHLSFVSFALWHLPNNRHRNVDQSGNLHLNLIIIIIIIIIKKDIVILILRHKVFAFVVGDTLG